MEVFDIAHALRLSSRPISFDPVDSVTYSILIIHTHVIYFSYLFEQSINSKTAYIQYEQKN